MIEVKNIYVHETASRRYCSARSFQGANKSEFCKRLDALIGARIGLDRCKPQKAPPFWLTSSGGMSYPGAGPMAQRDTPFPLCTSGRDVLHMARAESKSLHMAIFPTIWKRYDVEIWGEGISAVGSDVVVNVSLGPIPDEIIRATTR